MQQDVPIALLVMQSDMNIVVLLLGWPHKMKHNNCNNRRMVKNQICGRTSIAQHIEHTYILNYIHFMMKLKLRNMYGNEAESNH